VNLVKKSVKGSRPQEGTRSERTRRNRERMVATAYDLFVARGYADTTMADVAKAAGVAEQTLYYAFGTKAQLLQRAYDHAVLGPGNAVPPQQQDWYVHLAESESLQAALTVVVDNVAAVMARTAPLDEYIRGVAGSDPGAKHARQAAEALRRQGWTYMISQLAARFGLRADLDSRLAADIMLVVMSPTTYQSLVLDYGWSPIQWTDWCRDTLIQQLFAGRPGHAST
jgi:AcrR family transcriptional regulator